MIPKKKIIFHCNYSELETWVAWTVIPYWVNHKCKWVIFFHQECCAVLESKVTIAFEKRFDVRWPRDCKFTKNDFFEIFSFFFLNMKKIFHI